MFGGRERNGGEKGVRDRKLGFESEGGSSELPTKLIWACQIRS